MIRSSLEIKFWLRGPPDIDVVRPSRCSGCGAAGRAEGMPKTLVGHGVRLRQLAGPLVPDSGPETHRLFVRRFLCLACRAVLTVVPREVVPGHRYAAPAIALALVLFGVLGQPAEDVRAHIAVAPRAGFDGRRWRQLDRWPAALTDGRLFAGLVMAGGEDGAGARAACAHFARQLAARSRRIHGDIAELAMDAALMAIAPGSRPKPSPPGRSTSEGGLAIA